MVDIMVLMPFIHIEKIPLRIKILSLLFLIENIGLYGLQANSRYFEREGASDNNASSKRK